MPEFSAKDKLECLQAELYMREKTYPRKVERFLRGELKGVMSQERMDWQIGCMKAIVQDYQEKLDQIRGWGPTIK